MANDFLKILSVCGVILLSACIHSSGKNQVPALLSEVNQETKTELQRVVAQLLNQENVPIAHDAFKYRSFITIERLALLDHRGNRLQGRELDIPEKIQLFLIENECFLRREKNGNTIKLDGVICIPDK